MRQSSIRFVVTFVGFVAGWIALAASTATSGELPKLVVTHPIAGDRMISASNIAITGEFTPAFNTNVSFRVFRVLDNGMVIRQTGCSLSHRPDGKFAVTLEPPGDNWIPGHTRVVVSLDHLPQVRQAVDFEVTGEAVVVPVGRARLEPRSSDLVVRLPLTEVKVFELPPGVTYLVEGSLTAKRRLDKVTGPLIVCGAHRIRDDATRVTFDSAIGPSFVQPDGSCWYQIQLTSPDKSGLYHVKLKAFPPDSVESDPFGTSELPFSIRITEPGPAPKP